MVGLPADLRIGCSGWSYQDWRGTVYPPKAPTRDWFRLYAERFDTVEINNTFYRLPTQGAVEGWAAQAPAGFCFALKVGQYGTHRRKLKEPEIWLEHHLDRVRRLGPHLGPNLVQLPPRWRRDAGRLDAFLEAAPPDIRWAVEIRDPSWLHDDVFSVLERHRAALCIHDLLDDHPWRLTTDWTYVRFHGPQGNAARYQGRYGPRRLGPAARRLAGWATDGVGIYAYFNNDYDGHAVADAEWLRSALGAEPSAPAAHESDDPSPGRAGHDRAGPRGSSRTQSPLPAEGVIPMPQQAWSAKRERQYQHIKEGAKKRGEKESTAEEIAARTVNKERARSGETKTASKTSTKDISSGRRGGLRSHRGPGGRTKDQLYEEAKKKNIEGRSKMTKAQLEKAVGR